MRTSNLSRPRAGRSGGLEGAEPSSEKMAVEQKVKALRKAARRQARYLEQPSYLPGLFGLLLTRKRSAYPAHDDGPERKRKRITHRPMIEISRRRPRRAREPRSSKPRLHPPSPSPSSSQSSASSSSSSPSLPPAPSSPPSSPLSSGPSSCPPAPLPVSLPTEESSAERHPAFKQFMDLPAEIHDEILRYILRWPHDITVFNGWSLVYPRSRPRLQLSILYTCRMLKDLGLRILFGENTFAYDLRDPKVASSHTGTVIDEVFDGCVVPINKYGHLIRYVRIKFHRNRLCLNEHRQAFTKAILKFRPGSDLAHPANLHTLTLEVPALCNADLDPDYEMLEPKTVPICQYLKEEAGSYNGYNALFEIRTQWVRVLAWDKYNECWETNIDMRYYFNDENKAWREGNKHGTEDAANDQNVKRDADTTVIYRTRDVEAMEMLRAKKAESALAGLRNLATRIEHLANSPDLVVNKFKVWRPATNPSNGRGPKGSGEDEFVSLPPGFREPPLRGRTRSTTRAKPNPKLPTKPNSKSNMKSTTEPEDKSSTKAGTKNKKSPVNLSIFHARNEVNEQKLLKAQKGTQKKENGRCGCGTLTEEVLEDEDDADDDRVTVYWDKVEGNTAEEF
ncbi:hypothetical protein F5B22DRAFT_334011 [Xylaria bambusicola]|uniref:uncharacterized protein n=1 Tax=Xylaria bambusicola TaxID=326684 RepID=UPI0020081A84|nr:uncharacterized protein F5B22DRAFT_334011 [Xylaria bambusicola]KAI0525323.1 hypothetical protein F5B22DRAFT_334011 [Xylaria bambusicola]